MEVHRHDMPPLVNASASPLASSEGHATPARARLPNVLVLTPIYPWPGCPAEGIFVHRQIRNLVRLGHQCRVLSFRPGVPGLPRTLTRLSWLRYHPRWLSRQRALDGVPVDHVFYPQRRLRHRGDVIPDVAEALIRFIERHPHYLDTDIVYAHWLWTGGAAAIALRERFGWPVAAIARGSEMHAWQPVHPFCRPHVQRVLGQADLVLANCDALRDAEEALAPGSGERAHVVYNGCDASRFRPADSVAAVRARLGFAPELRYFVCCGSIIPRKGMSELADAWEAFAPRHPEWRLVVVGPAVSKPLAARLREAGPDTVRLVGRVDADDVLPYLQAADGYVQPSREEGLANATMEAMAVGVPVVSSTAGGQRELLRDGVNGWLVPVRDADALALAMADLARDPDHARTLGWRGRDTVLRLFDPLAHAARLSALLTALHTGRGR